MRSFIVCLLAIVIGTCVIMTSASSASNMRQLQRIVKQYHKLERELEALSDVFGMVENDDWCPDTGARSDAQVDQLISNMAGVKCLDEKLRILQSFLGASSETLTGPQINKIVPVFSEFVFVQIAVIGMIKPYIRGLQAGELVQLLKNVQSSGDRIKLLEALKNSVFGVQSHVETIAGAFSASDKDQIVSIIKSAKGMNCVFGRVDENSMVFVIDVSPSMNEVFDHPNGQKYSRFQYVKIQMEKMLRSLEPTQKFNVVAFSGGAANLRPALIPATPENVEQMIKDVYALKEGSYTDIMAGAANAFNMHPDAIYLLSDGVPNSGITRPSDMRSKIQTWNNSLRIAKGLRPIPINTISFLLGEPKIYPVKSWAAEKQLAADVLKTIATASGGVFKLLDDQ